MAAGVLKFNRRGVSLVEALTVIGIMGLLTSLLLPAVQSIRDTASRTSCLNNIREIGLAVHNYESHHGRLPPPPSNVRPSPFDQLSWMVFILPEVDQTKLWLDAVDACRVTPNTLRNPPHTGMTAAIPVYLCPLDSGRLRGALTDGNGFSATYTSYIGLGGGVSANGRVLPGVFSRAVGIRLTDVTDGLSQTLMMGERPPPHSLQAGRWYTSTWYLNFAGPDEVMVPTMLPYPGDVECSKSIAGFGPGRVDNPCDRYHFWSLHFGGASFLFADASARFLTYDARSILDALATIDGGEAVSIP